MINIVEKNPAETSIAQLATLLIDAGAMTSEQSAVAFSCYKTGKVSVCEAFWQAGVEDDTALGRALATVYQITFIEPDSIKNIPDLTHVLSEAFSIQHQIIPLSVDATKKRLLLLTLVPDQINVLDEVSLITGYRSVPCITAPKLILKLLDQFKSYHISTEDALAHAKKKLEIPNYSASSETESESFHTSDAPIVQLVNAILSDAIDKNASDVHVESQLEGLVVRFRIDGILRDMQTIPRHMAAAIVSRIKVTAGMDIAEHRRPQDGRIRFKTSVRTVDMRVNTLAIQHGESVVIRLLRSSMPASGLEKLGLHDHDINRLFQMIHAPNGIILVTGPTGSGKTTTLYSCLREINSRERKIITIEDPIEYPLTGINQTQISHKAGLDFSVALRAIMRHDPDIIMIGEIRDRETLQAAIQAALTGHLVFSTLHTNSTAKTITRLKEMGAPSYLISSTLVGVVAQRLARRICEHCKTSYQATPGELSALGFQHASQSIISLHKGVGCQHCEHTGYKGRLGLYEIMTLSKELQELIDSDASALSLQNAAINAGMTTLGMDGERKIAAGHTSVEEVNRILGVNW